MLRELALSLPSSFAKVMGVDGFVIETYSVFGTSCDKPGI